MELQRRLADHVYGSPSDRLRQNILVAINQLAVLMAQLTANSEKEVIEQQLRAIQFLTMQTIEELEDETGLFSSDVLKEVGMDDIYKEINRRTDIGDK